MAVLALPLHAAQAPSYQDGLKKATSNRPLVVFCYGANFDRINPEIYEKLFKGKDHSFSRVIRGLNYVVVPIYQLPTPAEKRAADKVMRGGRLPGGIRTYPCILLVDAQNNLRGSVQSAEDIESPEKAAVALTNLLNDYRKQQDLLEKAARAKGSNHTRYMREALAISSIRVPNHGMYDPSTGGIVEQLQVIKDIPTANAHVRNFISGGNYTLIERQMILVALAGYIRRLDITNHKKVVHTEILRALFTEIRNIDPKSIYGRYAEGAIKIWVVPNETNMEEKEAKKASKPAAASPTPPSKTAMGDKDTPATAGDKD